MSLKLSAADQVRLTSALHALLTPLVFPDLDGWRAAVNRSVRQLIGADMATFLLPAADAEAVYSDELDPHVARQYPLRAPEIPGDFDLWRRQVEQRVWNRALLYGPHLDHYYASAYYNDYVVPAGGRNAMGVTIPLAGQARPNTVAGLLFHRDGPEEPFQGGRELTLLALLLPAFRAGVDICMAHHGSRDRFAVVLDRAGSASLVLSPAGRLLHRTPAAGRLLDADPEHRRLLDAARRVAQALGSLAVADPATLPDPLLPDSEVATATARYRLAGSLLEEDAIGGERAVLVAIDRLTPQLPTEGHVRERFGLTRRQAEVALLLAQGRSNREIAEALYLSVHTVHHHTEQVLARLGVHSRAAVGPALLRP